MTRSPVQIEKTSYKARSEIVGRNPSHYAPVPSYSSCPHIQIVANILQTGQMRHKFHEDK